MLRVAGVVALFVCASASLIAAQTLDCPADCDGDREVRLAELVAAVNAALHPPGLQRCVAADGDGSGAVTIDELIAAVDRSLSACPSTPTPTPTPTASSTPTVGLGVRRFSIEPASSPLLLVLGPDAVISNLPGFGGFLELRAGEPDGETGLAFVDVTGASEFVAIDIPDQPAAFCIRPTREAFPVLRAGVLSCSAGFGAGLLVSQDHRLGEIGRCTGGEVEGDPCEGDGDCAGGQCFDEADCSDVGGRSEGASEPHPGLCNEALLARRAAKADGPGALLIARDEETGTIGLPVEIFMETSTPCGDEEVPGMSTEIGLTSAATRIRIDDLNAAAGETLEYTAAGESFSCEEWNEENGPGMLVFAGISLDVPILAGMATDLVTVFVWDD